MATPVAKKVFHANAGAQVRYGVFRMGIAYVAKVAIPMCIGNIDVCLTLDEDEINNFFNPESNVSALQQYTEKALAKFAPDLSFKPPAKETYSAINSEDRCRGEKCTTRYQWDFSCK